MELPAIHAGTNGLPHVGHALAWADSSAVTSREIVLGCTPNRAAMSTREDTPDAMSWTTCQRRSTTLNCRTLL